uniref:Uncharacterized protein n=1 Tax=Rhizochromulina marina TaxID=1034831 RepID=A0A7S2STR4_9STRA|mmetsp:Transcript_773/g.2480  ORF Transcript_773/g.2480 Transcript_773/m.2480 type:complete len:220 (+) Transcript_773:121-780(+)|eukprot:CAMPEP_0118965790 /NCGR_PEP_ID=MMETSP1173-20130426/3310_1 /TAXON_ID=1034831 /ORGANISM="Rhizochromulina marina cf, Strain CCMP1243" /LENGTH=219 /DNA_ID=CAMNT_0006914463 /DNA_START=93 /DNA_END=752 /DNA_ORIENTATION=+
MSRLILRIYTRKSSVFEQHSFLVGTEQGGLSNQIGTLPFDEATTTVGSLRERIEVQVDRNMVRRNPIYQEYISVMSYIPNPEGFTSKQLRRYCFGYFKTPEDEVPTIIPVDSEDELLVSEVIEDYLKTDLLLIPQVQVGLDGKFVSSQGKQRESGSPAAHQVGTEHHTQRSGQEPGLSHSSIEGAQELGALAAESHPPQQEDLVLELEAAVAAAVGKVR